MALTAPRLFWNKCQRDITSKYKVFVFPLLTPNGRVATELKQRVGKSAVKGGGNVITMQFVIFKAGKCGNSSCFAGSKAHAEQKWSHLHRQDTPKGLLNLKPELLLTISCHKNSTNFHLFCFYPPNPTVCSPKNTSFLGKTACGIKSKHICFAAKSMLTCV